MTSALFRCSYTEIQHKNATINSMVTEWSQLVWTQKDLTSICLTVSNISSLWTLSLYRALYIHHIEDTIQRADEGGREGGGGVGEKAIPPLSICCGNVVA